MKAVRNKVAQNLADGGDRLPYVTGPALLVMGVSYPDHMPLFWAMLSLWLLVAVGYVIKRSRR